jgi:hypothetical protein
MREAALADRRETAINSPDSVGRWTLCPVRLLVIF